jgi:hypothetical protein
MKPLLFIPSVREIPEVIDSWNALPYDKFIVKYRLEKEAYQNGKNFFLNHEEYTHLVICPDDLVLHYDAFEMLKRDVEEHDFLNLCGVSFVDEDSSAYCCKPMGVDITKSTKESYYQKTGTKGIKDNQILPNEIFDVSFTGFTCQWISRDLMEKLSFDGGCNDGKGCMDLQFAYDMKGIPMLVEPNAYFTHLRNRCKNEVKEWLVNGDHTGYSVYLKNGEEYKINSIT